MTERLTSAFTALAERGTVAGADAVWQRAVRGAGNSGASGALNASSLVRVQPKGGSGGRHRIGVVFGVAAAVVLAAGVATLAVRSGRDDAPTVPGASTEPSATTPVAAPEFTSPSIAPTTAGGQGLPAETIAIAPLADQPVRACHAAAYGTEPPLVTTAEPDPAASPTTFPPPEPCAEATGTLPPTNLDDGSVESPITVPADQPVAYWRIVDDLEIGWRMDDGMSVLYWRTPAGTGRVLDDFFGSKVVLVPTADAYLVLARPDVHAGSTRGPALATLTFADGSELGGAPFEYDNEISIGVARFPSTAPVTRVTVS